MNLNNFRGQFVESFQQDNRFLFQLSLGDLSRRLLSLEGTPAGLLVSQPIGTLASATEQGIKWLERGLVCANTRVPDRAFDVVQMTQYGITEKFPFKTDYTTLDCTFYLPLHGGSSPISRIFYLWQNVIQNNYQQGSGCDFTWPNDYYAQARIFLLNRGSQTVSCYHFTKVYPTSVESIPVSWASESEFAKLNVTFAFSAWYQTDEQASIDSTDYYPELPFVPEMFSDPNRPANPVGTGWSIPWLSSIANIFRRVRV